METVAVTRDACLPIRLKASELLVLERGACGTPISRFLREAGLAAARRAIAAEAVAHRRRNGGGRQ